MRTIVITYLSPPNSEEIVEVVAAMVVYVMTEIVENLGLELAVDDFYDHPTVDGLSRSLAEERRPAA